VLLLEVGLGGRLDATNVIAQPIATVVTPVSFDHADYLGESVAKIAAEKAGIFKRGVPAIVAAQLREARAVIERAAARVAAPIRIAGEDWTATEERGRLVYQDDDGLLDLPAPRLPGRHQFENAGVAIATLRAVPTVSLVPTAFEAVAKAEWPARMQRLSQGKLLELLPTGSELWLDGGHNAEGGRAIANALADLEERVSRPLVLIVGMLASKDAGAFLKNFSGLARGLFAVSIPDQQNSLSAEAIAELARAADMPAQARDTIGHALASVGALGLDPLPRVMITGSLYLAGAVLKANGTPPT
jgi:dihydrofolate synthase/folylpolyglutamate synthase